MKRREGGKREVKQEGENKKKEGEKRQKQEQIGQTEISKTKNKQERKGLCQQVIFHLNSLETRRGQANHFLLLATGALQLFHEFR